MKLSTRNNKQFIIFVVPIISLISLGTFLLISKPWQDQSKNEVKKEVKLLDYESQEYGFKLKYPDDFIEGKIAEEDKNKNPIMLKLVSVEPPALATVWKETGLGLLALYSKKPLLEILKANVDSMYPSKYNDFQKEKFEDSKLAGLDAFTVWFTFQDPDKDYREKIKLTVTIKDNIAYYLQCMAPVEMFTYAEPSCDLISTSLQFLMKEARPPSSE